MFIIFCLSPYLFSSIQKKDLKGRKAAERRIMQREGCEGQEEVKKYTGGKPVKGIYTILLRQLKDRQGGRPTQRRRNKARWLNQTACNQKQRWKIQQ